MSHPVTHIPAYHTSAEGVNKRSRWGHIPKAFVNHWRGDSGKNWKRRVRTLGLGFGRWFWQPGVGVGEVIKAGRAGLHPHTHREHEWVKERPLCFSGGSGEEGVGRMSVSPPHLTCFISYLKHWSYDQCLIQQGVLNKSLQLYFKPCVRIPTGLTGWDVPSPHLAKLVLQ